MKKLVLILVILVVAFTNLLTAQEYKIIVNKSNSVSSLTSEEISRYFLKKVTKWEDGSEVFPIDLPESDKVRKEFTKEVLGKSSIAAIKAYWQKQIFAGRMSPPEQKSKDSEIIDFVKENDGAIGYVSASASTGSVKVVKIKND